MENQWNGWKIYGTWPNMATYFPGSIGLVAYLVEFGRPGKDMCFFLGKKEGNLYKYFIDFTSLKDPWLIFDLNRFSGSLFLFKSI